MTDIVDIDLKPNEELRAEVLAELHREHKYA